jgi:hypothetical protein
MTLKIHADLTSTTGAGQFRVYSPPALSLQMEYPPDRTVSETKGWWELGGTDKITAYSKLSVLLFIQVFRIM